MDSCEVSSDEARRDWRRLISDVESGGRHVTVMRYGVPAAVIVPVQWHEQATAALAQGEEKP